MRDNLEKKADVKNKEKLSLYRNSPDSYTAGISTHGQDTSIRLRHPLPFLLRKTRRSPITPIPSPPFSFPQALTHAFLTQGPQALLRVGNTISVCLCPPPIITNFHEISNPKSTVISLRSTLVPSSETAGILRLCRQLKARGRQPSMLVQLKCLGFFKIFIEP